MFKKLLTGCVAFLFLLSGCATSQICATPEADNSVICKVCDTMHTSPEQLNLMFKLINVELIKSDAITKAECLAFLDSVESMLESVSYNELTNYIMLVTGYLNNSYSVELILLTETFTQFQGIEMSINDFDIGLLRKHIKQQKALLGMFQ